MANYVRVARFIRAAAAVERVDAAFVLHRVGCRRGKGGLRGLRGGFRRGKNAYGRRCVGIGRGKAPAHAQRGEKER